MLAQLGVKFSLGDADLEGEANSWFGLAPGTAVEEKSNLFPRQEKDAAKIQSSPEATSLVNTPHIEFEDFAKVDLRVGTVLAAKVHPAADRLLVLEIDAGEEEPRQIVAGLAEFWKPEELAGRQVVMVANLKPRKLRGLVSQGMVLAVKQENGLQLLTPTGKVANGSRVS